MLKIGYAASFVRRYKKLSPALQREVRQKIEEFKNPKNHRALEVHKLSGRMKGRSAFSVTFSDRIVFGLSKDKKTAYLFDVGDHGVYE
jgi:mRNA-degrading endonuclease YafQ of YafQ-DinJ toxin-antitoxin module